MRHAIVYSQRQSEYDACSHGHPASEGGKPVARLM
jgi:hypothetical protein